MDPDNSLFSEAAANITEKCCQCEQIVPIDKLRSHVEACYQEKELCSNEILNIVIECSPSSELADDLSDPDIFNGVSAFTTSDNTKYRITVIANI